MAVFGKLVPCMVIEA